VLCTIHATSGVYCVALHVSPAGVISLGHFDIDLVREICEALRPAVVYLYCRVGVG
jgi:hypothetical protein